MIDGEEPEGAALDADDDFVLQGSDAANDGVGRAGDDVAPKPRPRRGAAPYINDD